VHLLSPEFEESADTVLDQIFMHKKPCERKNLT